MAGTLIACKSVGTFQANMRAQVRGLWNGIFTIGQFQVGMIDAIQKGFEQAWKVGAAECGIRPDEQTDEERGILQGRINEQFMHIQQYGNHIAANAKENGGKLSPLYQRLQMWVFRFEEIRNQAKAMACANRKLKWVLGVSEHCSSCQRLAGKVKRGSFWNDKGILPRKAGASYLECGGWRCQCDLVPTDDPVSKGPLPSLP